MLEGLKFAYIKPGFSAKSRLEDLKKWSCEWRNEDNRLTEKLRQVNMNSRVGEQIADRIATIRTRQEMNKIKIPIGISTEELKGVDFSDLYNELVNQYATFESADKLIWMDNFLFIMTTNLHEAIKKIDDILKENSTRQIRGLLLTGDSRMGKTTFLDYIWCQFRPYIADNRNIVPVVKVEAPANNLGPKTLPQRMVQEFGLTYSLGDNEERLSLKVRAFMQICETRIFIIDEAENIRTKLMQRKLIELWNSFPKVLIICSSCNLQQFVAEDQEVEGRWDAKHTLERFREQDLSGLLTFLEILLPFTSPSFLYENPNLEFIRDKTRGNLSKIMNLITEASKTAVEEHLSCLTHNLLELTWKRRYGSE